MYMESVTCESLQTKSALTFKGINQHRVKNSQPRIVLIDDDPIFLLFMEKWAELEAINLESFSSLAELSRVGGLSQFDAAIIDYDLGAMTGVDIAFDASRHPQQLPIIIVSYRDRSRECLVLPGCVKEILLKSVGYKEILTVAGRYCSEF